MGVGMKEILQKQREFFKRGATLPPAFRLDSLRKLKSAIKNYESRICSALYKDLGKSETESYMCEISLCLGEIDYFLKNLKKLSKDKTVPTPLSNFYSKSYKNRSNGQCADTKPVELSFFAFRRAFNRSSCRGQYRRFKTERVFPKYKQFN